jgi:hypothetical protein
MDRGRPPPFDGALVVPNQRRLERMDLIEWGLQPATSVIWAVFRDLLIIISRISWCCDVARFGAMPGAWSQLAFGLEMECRRTVGSGLARSWHSMHLTKALPRDFCISDHYEFFAFSI